jgi:PmbA protein
MDVRVFAKELFQRGKSHGFSDMEVYYENHTKQSLNVYQEEVDSFSIATDSGLSFRGLYQGKMGYAYTEKIEESSLDMLVHEARENAAIIESGEVEQIFAGSPIYRDLSLYDTELDLVDTSEMISFLVELERAAKSYDPRVSNVRSCQMGVFRQERLIANTRGFERSEKSNLLSLYLHVLVRDGEDVKSAYRVWFGKRLKDWDPSRLAREVVEEALSYLGATPVESRSYPVVLRNQAAASLLGAFVPVFSAENVQKGKSLLAGKLGGRIAAPHLQIVDDPFLEDGLMSRSFDSEGVATQRRLIVKNGVLQTFLHNLKTAHTAGVTSTGHGYKPSYKGTVGIAPSNFFVEPGDASYESLFAAQEECVIVTSVAGLHSGTNPVSGDFSLAAHGYLARGGKIVRPVNQITIAGNFFELLRDIELVGNDLAFALPSGSGYIGSPSIRVRQLAVSGS